MRNADMKKSMLRRLFQAGMSVLFFCLAVMASATAETISTASLKKGYTIAELDQMLAPVALYPDGLLLQVLMASTHPAEVMEASRWLNANAGLSGDAAVEAAERFEWDVSTQSLLAFPDVLFTLSSNMDWTVKLGNAFHTQQEDVMARVQHLRRQARAQGNLQSDERMKVTRTGNSIAIEPVSPEIIYVPYYNPSIVYGSWWWPRYAPYYWRPWRGYAYYPGYYSSSLMWGRGIRFSYTRFHGRADWRRRHVHWNPPLRHPAPGHVRPGNRPQPSPGSVRPGNRPGQGAPGSARPGIKPGQAGTSHLRPGYARPGHNRPSATITTRPEQRPGLAGAVAYRPAHNRPAHTGPPIHHTASSRPLASHPDTGAVHTRFSRIAHSAARPAARSHQTGTHSSRNVSFQRGGHQGGSGR